MTDQGALLARTGAIDTPGTVKRRLLLVASVMAIAVSGVYTVAAMGGPSPWTAQETKDMAGLPEPPVRYAPNEDGDIRKLSPAEYAQLQEIRSLIERFPVPDEFVNIRTPGSGRKGGG